MPEAHIELTEALRDQAALYSLGLMEDSEIKPYERHLANCPLCRDEARGAVELLTTVTEAAAPEVAPPVGLKQKLLARIAEPAVEPSPKNAGLILRATEGRWRKTFPGIEARRLFVDPITNSVTSLVRVAAGAIYPAHIHKGLEHLYVLDGEIVFDDHTLSTGDYEVRTPETKHSSATTAPGEDCLLLVVNSGQDEFLSS